jgi:alkylation response protein AidB-like acyl-CoA dehydrogenase
MDFEEPANWAKIRHEAEAFAREHVDATVHENQLRTGDGVDKALFAELGRRGWIAPTWPVAEGGAGLDHFEAGVLSRVLGRAGVPINGYGTTMLAADAVREKGSGQLKRAVLPGVAAGTTLICLGYSEPDGGSDIFACKTRASRNADGSWRINGQKMFTTYAHMAEYCFLLTRTDPESRGSRGLTMFLVPLDTDGIEHQAVRTMAYERTNVVYYDDVRVKDFWRIGEVDHGLAVLQVALDAEHKTSPASQTAALLADARRWAEQTPGPDGGLMIEDTLVRERLAGAAIDAEVTELLGLRAAFYDDVGDDPGPLAALYGPESYLHWAGEFIDAAGPAGVLDWTSPHAAIGGAFEYHYRSAVGTTIYGGTSEILRSIIAEQRLGLPRSRPRR